MDVGRRCSVFPGIPVFQYSTISAFQHPGIPVCSNNELRNHSKTIPLPAIPLPVLPLRSGDKGQIWCGPLNREMRLGRTAVSEMVKVFAEHGGDVTSAVND